MPRIGSRLLPRRLAGTYPEVAQPATPRHGSVIEWNDNHVSAESNFLITTVARFLGDAEPDIRMVASLWSSRTGFGTGIRTSVHPRALPEAEVYVDLLLGGSV